MSAIRWLSTWPTTETTPTAPTESSGRFSVSSPEYQARPVEAMTEAAAATSPLASLLATMRGCSAMRSNVSDSIGRPVRPGMS